MCLAVGAVDRSRRHHHHRNERAINDNFHDEPDIELYGSFHLYNDGSIGINLNHWASDDVLIPDGANDPEYNAALSKFLDAAAAILDVPVDPAGNRGTTHDDGELWQLLLQWLDAHGGLPEHHPLRDAIAARYRDL